MKHRKFSKIIYLFKEKDFCQNLLNYVLLFRVSSIYSQKIVLFSIVVIEVGCCYVAEMTSISLIS